MDPRDPNTNPPQADRDVHLQGVQYERDPGARFAEHIKNTGCICNSSAAHTYGNVIAIVEKWILDTFPNGLFKTVTASTTLASRQVTHTPKQFHKKELPMMVIVPRVQFGQDDNRFLSHTLINSRYTNTHSTYGDGSLLPLAEDPRKRLYVHGHYNRAVMYIDVVLSFHTYSEQVNWMSFIHNMIPIGHNQFIRAPLELYIPGEFCELIGKLSKIPVRNNNGEVYDFLTYMNSVWHYPITYKLKGGSNSDEFFMYYLADIDTVFQEPQAGPGVKNGQTRSNFDISFTVRCDFNTIGYFTMNHPDIKRDMYVAPSGDDAVIPIFTDSINLNDFNLPVGWSILSWPIFKLAPGENSLSIDPILNQSLRTVINYHLKTGIPMDRFIKVQFRENGEILRHEAFHIDWATKTLTIMRPNHRRTYRLIITVSHEYVNSLIKSIYKLE